MPLTDEEHEMIWEMIAESAERAKKRQGKILDKLNKAIEKYRKKNPDGHINKKTKRRD